MPSQNTLSVGNDQPMQQRAIPSSIEDLDRAVSGLESMLYNLTAQLHPILDEALAGVGDKSQTAAAAPYHYSSQIGDLTARIRAISARGNDILSRLHV